MVFVGARVLEDWSRDLRFPMIERVLVQFFEGEVIHEVAQASPKFRCNPLSESGDWVMQS
jgi:glycerophosphoryl diester phosphodiesterase